MSSSGISLDEARGLPVAVDAVQAALLGVGEVQLLHGARHADVAQPPLLLEPLEIDDRALVREQALLQAGTGTPPGTPAPWPMCSVIICTQSSHASAWPSPDSSAACARNACQRRQLRIASGAKPRAALTSSSRFSTRASPRSAFSRLVVVDEARALEHRDRPARGAEPRRLARQALDERDEAREPRRGPAGELGAVGAERRRRRLPQRGARGCARARAASPGSSRRCPRVGRFTTRSKEASSRRLAMRRR